GGGSKPLLFIRGFGVNGFIGRARTTSTGYSAQSASLAAAVTPPIFPIASASELISESIKHSFLSFRCG
ncbi:hypothetical protein, partial [Bacillus cereus group sp. Bce002]|uniref:hypothetical protein n=1 Tax=Bacillus cereus group sp. Bce002 TaxID=3445259 RepID=UPI003F696D8E